MEEIREKVLIDTNLLVYSVNKDSVFYATTRKTLKILVERSLLLCISIQNLNEFLRVTTSKKYGSVPLSIKEATEYVNIYKNNYLILYPKEKALTKNLELAEKYKITGSKIYDTFLVATMLENGIKTIVTNNTKDFAFYNEIGVYDVDGNFD